MGTLFYRLEEDKSFRVNIFLYQRNRPKTSSYYQGEIYHDRKVSVNRGTDREYHLQLYRQIPHIFKGA